MNLPTIILISIGCGFFVSGYSPIKGAPLQTTHAATNNCNIAPIDGEAMAIGLRDGPVNVKEQFVGKGVVFQPSLSTQRQTVCDKCHEQQPPDCQQQGLSWRHVAILWKKSEVFQHVGCVVIGSLIGLVLYSCFGFPWEQLDDFILFIRSLFWTRK